jgi:drug/metabolite transporter (DMT)-like permease
MSAVKLPIAAAFAAVCLIWGSTFFAILVGLETIPPFLLAGVRFLTAGAILYAVLRFRGVPSPTFRQWKNAALIGVLLCTLGNGLVTYSEQWVSSSLAALFVATIPLWSAIFVAFRGQVPALLEWIALGIGFAGVMVLNLGGDLKAAGWAGALAILVAPLSWAFGSVKSRELELPPGVMSSATQLLAGGTVLVVAGFVLGERVPAEVSMRSGLALLYLIVFGSIVAFTAYTYLLKTTRPAIATAYAYVNPLVAMVLGSSFAGEELGGGTVFAATCIIGSVALLGFAKTRQAPILLGAFKELVAGRAR